MTMIVVVNSRQRGRKKMNFQVVVSLLTLNMYSCTNNFLVMK